MWSGCVDDDLLNPRTLDLFCPKAGGAGNTRPTFTRHQAQRTALQLALLTILLIHSHHGRRLQNSFDNKEPIWHDLLLAPGSRH